MARRKSVLMALASTHHGFFRGISKYAGEHGWHLNTFMAYSGKIPYGWRGDGIISFSGYRDDLAEFIRQAPFPKVELSLLRDDLDVPKVASNNYHIGELAAQYLLERYFKNFAWAPFADDIPDQERLAGFKNTLEKVGLDFHTLPTVMASREHSPGTNWSESRITLIESLKRIPKPFAVFAYNDGVGVEVIDACLEAGLLVPEEVAVLGVDNDRIVCESVPIPLSSVQYDLEDLSYAGAALLDRLMNGEKPPKSLIRVQPKGIYTRLSTDILAMDNVEVAKALRYIWTHYHDASLSAELVATQTALTSRGLRKAFQKTLHRSIHQEIMRVRMEKVTELLKAPGHSVANIASQTGFASANNLFRAFRRLHGISPGEHRKRFGSK
jgi:LacI family transcriptional regulator